LPDLLLKAGYAPSLKPKPHSKSQCQSQGQAPDSFGATRGADASLSEPLLPAFRLSSGFLKANAVR